jgi:predicted phosphodiesterase
MESPIRRFGAIGDVHAEDTLLAAALDTLRAEQLDAILCVGDIVDGRGDVDRCCALLAQHDAIVVRGNHERWLLKDELRTLPKAHLASDLAPATRAYLEALPATRRLSTTRGPLLLCHGLGDDDMARLRPFDEGYALETNDALSTLRATDYALVVGGHTHLRMVRSFGALTVVNAGTLSYTDTPCFLVADLLSGHVQFYDLDDDARVLPAERYPLGPSRGPL